MVHSGYLGDVVDVVDQVAERRTGYLVRITPLQLLHLAVGDLLAFGSELTLEFLGRLIYLGLLRLVPRPDIAGSGTRSSN